MVAIFVGRRDHFHFEIERSIQKNQQERRHSPFLFRTTFVKFEAQVEDLSFVHGLKAIEEIFGEEEENLFFERLDLLLGGISQ